MTAATPPDADRAHTRKQRRQSAIGLIVFITVFIGIFWLLYWLVWGRFYIYTDDAYVAGNMVELMPQIPGTIVAIYADDTQLVLQGQPVIKLDDTDMTVALQHARGRLALTVRKVRQYFEEVQQAQANLTLTKANWEKATLDLKRRVGLVGAQAISKELMQHHVTLEQTARAQYEFALHRLAAARALVENTSLYEHPQVVQAKAEFKNAYLNWVRTTIYAPVTGFVAKRTAQVGQQVNLGTALLAIVPLNDVWVDANYKETQLKRLRIGQPVSLIADANGIRYHGEVQGLGAGTGNAFALLPPQNATGNWIKIVQRLPVRIRIKLQELVSHPLQLGLSMRVTVNTHDLSGPILATVTNSKPIYTTPIFNDQLAHANNEIHQILQMNAGEMSLDDRLSQWLSRPTPLNLFDPARLAAQSEADNILRDNAPNLILEAAPDVLKRYAVKKELPRA